MSRRCYNIMLHNILIKLLSMNIFNSICLIHINTFETNFLWSYRQLHKLFSYESYVSVLFLLIELHPSKVSHPHSKKHAHFSKLIMRVHKELKWTISQLNFFLS